MKSNGGAKFDPPEAAGKNRCSVRMDGWEGVAMKKRTVSALLMLALCVSTLVALSDRAPGASGPCDNDRLRALQASEGLPDCRAFEQVTQSEKHGVDVTGTVPFVKAAPGGGSVTFLDNSNSSALLEYTPTIAHRDEGSWSSEGLLPGQSGPSPEMIGLTPGLTESFHRVNDPAELSDTALLSRSSVDGSLSTVVPYTTDLRPRFVGASEDGSLVVFESTAALPAAGPAISGEPNLYAWDRASGQVRSIGVLNGGAPLPEGALGGSYDWIRGTTEATLGEGGATRDYYTQDQHVVSASGSSVYFTAAGTGQVYLRRNPGSPQSPIAGGDHCADAALACTVRISASRKTNGVGVGGADPLGPSPAAFIGASADGARAFFTSGEELTNDANTGPDQFPPGVGRAAVDGSPGSFEPEFLGVAAAGIAVDDTHIYWANPTRGSIGRAGLDGSGVEEDFVAGVGQPRWVAVDDEYVYWTNAGAAEGPGEGTIGRARLDGGAPEPDFISGASKPQGIAINDSHIFWANDGTHAIARAKIDGSEVEPVFHFLGVVEVPQGVALDDSHIYWTVNSPTSYVSRSDLDGSHETFRFIGANEELRGIAVDGDHVYWASQGGHVVGRANLELGEPVLQHIAGVGRAAGLAVDGLHIYWGTRGLPSLGNDLYRYDAGSGDLVDLAPDPDDANGADVLGVLGISADGSYVYFAANGVLADAPNGHGETALPGSCDGGFTAGSGSCNLYAFHAGTIEFIARLEIDGGTEGDAVNWVATPAGVSTDPDFQRTARLSADGGTLLFRSRRQLTGYPNQGVPELYLYRVGAPGPICVSCNPGGEAPAGPATLGTIAAPTSFRRRPMGVLSHNLSASGNRVFFESVDPLVEADRNGAQGCPRIGFPSQEFPACQDVYEWQAEGSGSCLSATASGGCLHLLSGGHVGQPSFFAAASAEGEDAFFFTRAQLVQQDDDELMDVYDARVNGGLATQNEAPVDCVGEECRPPPSPPPPADALPATVGPGHHRARHAPRRCRKGKHAPRRRCGKHWRGRR